MLSPLAALLIGILPAADAHADQNPLYARLVADGIELDGRNIPPLMKPVLADGLDAAAQKAAMTGLLKGRFPLAEFVRQSVSAPSFLKIGDLVEYGDYRVRTLDLYFVAYGNLDALRKNREWMDRMVRKGEGEGHVLTADELAKRGIEVEPGLADRTRFASASAAVLDRVEVALTTQTVWSESSESTLAAAIADPRFAGDAEYPNTWCTLDLDAAGQKVLGPTEPYSVTASYWKATQLKEPKEAIFMEFHIVFEQPKKWFRGNDLLKSKMPMAVQSELRLFRRKFQQATEGQR